MDLKPLPIDLRSRSRPPRWAWMGVALLIVAAAAAGIVAVVSHRQLQQMLAAQAELSRQRDAPQPVESIPVVPVAAYDASARAALAQAQAEWPSLLTALESIEIVGVTPVSIEVSTADRHVRVELEFTDFAGVLQFIDELNVGEVTPRWQLVQTQGTPRVSGASMATGATQVAAIRGIW